MQHTGVTQSRCPLPPALLGAPSSTLGWVCPVDYFFFRVKRCAAARLELGASSALLPCADHVHVCACACAHVHMHTRTSMQVRMRSVACRLLAVARAARLRLDAIGIAIEHARAAIYMCTYSFTCMHNHSDILHSRISCRVSALGPVAGSCSEILDT